MFWCRGASRFSLFLIYSRRGSSTPRSILFPLLNGTAFVVPVSMQRGQQENSLSWQHLCSAAAGRHSSQVNVLPKETYIKRTIICCININEWLLSSDCLGNTSLFQLFSIVVAVNIAYLLVQCSLTFQDWICCAY